VRFPGSNHFLICFAMPRLLCGTAALFDLHTCRVSSALCPNRTSALRHGCTFRPAHVSCSTRATCAFRHAFSYSPRVNPRNSPIFSHFRDFQQATTCHFRISGIFVIFRPFTAVAVSAFLPISGFLADFHGFRCFSSPSSYSLPFNPRISILFHPFRGA